MSCGGRLKLPDMSSMPIAAAISASGRPIRYFMTVASNFAPDRLRIAVPSVMPCSRSVTLAHRSSSRGSTWSRSATENATFSISARCSRRRLHSPSTTWRSRRQQ